MSTNPGVTTRPSASIVSRRLAVDVADRGDAVAVDGDVGRDRRAPGAVDDRPVPDHEVVCHACPPWTAVSRSLRPAKKPPLRPRPGEAKLIL